jgi:hypothetical protein
MLDATDTEDCPWHVIRSDDKRRARLNIITHILNRIPHQTVKKERVKLPKRAKKDAYEDQATMKGRKYVEEVY